MSILFKFSADNSDVVAKLNEIKQQKGNLSWADMAMGVQAVVGLLNQAKSAIAGFMAPAAPPFWWNAGSSLIAKMLICSAMSSPALLLPLLPA